MTSRVIVAYDTRRQVDRGSSLAHPRALSPLRNLIDGNCASDEEILSFLSSVWDPSDT